jgi:S-disulfanyl-L-cysteine oxidoreductase SoxD
MHYFSKMLIFGILFSTTPCILAQGLNYNIGRTPTETEISEWDTPLDPAGNELPEGSGTASQGSVIYQESCVSCHGDSGGDGNAPGLTGYLRIYPINTWDKIYRTMPLSTTGAGTRERKLSPDEVYALTAYILHLNGMAALNDTLNKQNLAEVRIPMPELTR